MEYEVHLLESDRVQRDQEGVIVHHPLGYKRASFGGYGFLMYDPKSLSKTQLLDDAKVFYLEFLGEVDPYDREAWADPLRTMVLKHLRYKDWNWYLSFIGDLPDSSTPGHFIPISQEIQDNIFWKEIMNFVIVQTPERYAIKERLKERPFLEVPEQFLPQVLERYWPRAYPAYPIQGLHMAPGQIEQIKAWSEKPPSDLVVREMIDQVFVAFFTWPAENNHFVFVTNKLDLEDMKQLIHLDELQEMAGKIGARNKG